MPALRKVTRREIITSQVSPRSLGTTIKRKTKVERVEKKGREEKKEKGKQVARREKVRDDENGARQLAC